LVVQSGARDADLGGDVLNFPGATPGIIMSAIAKPTTHRERGGAGDAAPSRSPHLLRLENQLENHHKIVIVPRLGPRVRGCFDAR
jgi:hypothetical protein